MKTTQAVYNSCASGARETAQSLRAPLLHRIWVQFSEPNMAVHSACDSSFQGIQHLLTSLSLCIHVYIYIYIHSGTQNKNFF